MNEQNLISLADRPAADKKKIARMGGIASGAARREKRRLADTLKDLLETDDTQEQIALALINAALKGNTKAFEVIRDTIGEKPADKVQIQDEVIRIGFDDAV